MELLLNRLGPLTTDVKILFADESKETLAVYKTIMHKLCWTGYYATNAVDIIDRVNETLGENVTLDAIVADITYLSGPRVTGITAAREIRKALPNVPIVFISSYVTSIIREEVRRVNAEIIPKPFDPEKLFLRLSQLIYWNRLATASDFTGEDRRKNSVNRTDSFRRASDYILSTPERIQQALADIRSEDNERRP